MVLIGYMRVSKADGSQVLDLQRDALLAAGVASDRFYQDHASCLSRTAYTSPADGIPRASRVSVPACRIGSRSRH